MGVWIKGSFNPSLSAVKNFGLSIGLELLFKPNGDRQTKSCQQGKWSMPHQDGETGTLLPLSGTL